MHPVEEVLRRILEEKYLLSLLKKGTLLCCFLQHKWCHTLGRAGTGMRWCLLSSGAGGGRPASRKAPELLLLSIFECFALLSASLAESRLQVWQTFT